VREVISTVLALALLLQTRRMMTAKAAATPTTIDAIVDIEILSEDYKII